MPVDEDDAVHPAHQLQEVRGVPHGGRVAGYHKARRLRLGVDDGHQSGRDLPSGQD